MNKIVKGFGLVSLVLIGACSNEPEYSPIPHIELVDLQFIEGTPSDPLESLVVNVSFTDGNGDLGLSDDEIDPPYNDIFYGLANDGKVIEVGKKTVYSDLPQFVDVPDGVSGKLITTRTAADPAYADDLPTFKDPWESCVSYQWKKIYVREQDKRIIDGTYAEIDTLRSANGAPLVFRVSDFFYFRYNPNYTNIDVEFWVKDSSGSYNLFDWKKEYCEWGFSQRFPIQSAKSDVLKYEMTSFGIKKIFKEKTLRFKIRIRDRALNVSNEIVTPDFTLDSIKK